MLMAATHAAGAPISVASAIVIYATALAASLVSIIPAGVGVVEASTGAMLIGIGIPLPVAALSVALFRIFDLWLPVVAGAFIGRKDFESETEGISTRPPTDVDQAWPGAAAVLDGALVMR